MQISPDTPLSAVLHILGKHIPALKKLGLLTVRDLLYYFPFRYGGIAPTRAIESIRAGETVVLYGEVGKLEAKKAFVSKINMARAVLKDNTGSIELVWFNQPYLAKMLGEGALVRVEGRVSAKKKTANRYLSNPKVEKVSELPDGGGDTLFAGEVAPSSLSPVYPETRGITSNWLYHAVQKIFARGALDTFEDPVPKDVLDRYHLPSLKTALVWIHAPQKEADAEAARKRFAFEEIFTIQIEQQRARNAYGNGPCYKVESDNQSVEQFLARFPFSATNVQQRAIEVIISDMKSGTPMQRLLEGDVGSGKTAVAATAAYTVVTTRPVGRTAGTLQAAYMAPTEILATQHFESFITYYRHLPIKIGLLTGSSCRVFPSKVSRDGWTEISRSQLLKWVASGEIAILVGTHALIQKSVKFKHLAFAVIDEQHRFGTNQRRALVRRAAGESAPVPHLLSMTATPIPRTLALTVYGDLDLSVLDELPAGRKPVQTAVIAPDSRKAVYEEMRTSIKEGRQAYVICPRIDEPDPAKELALEVKSVKEEAKRLAEEVFPEFDIGLLHGKMKAEEKDWVMNEFKEKRIHILVATSVIEVGVNVPNATIIIIGGAERFGLAQLHQLRGRVQRSSHRAKCFIFADAKTGDSAKRLKMFAETRDGFVLAEEDLKRRGAGQLTGGKQWGVSDVAMDALKNLRLVEAARDEAKKLLAGDSTLSRYPALLSDLARRGAGEVHFE